MAPLNRWWRLTWNSSTCLETPSGRAHVRLCACEREGIVGGDEGPVGGVAQVVCHGVKVVGVHGEEGREEDDEVQGEVKGEVEQLREKRSSWMVCG